MATTLKFGGGNWGVKQGSTLAYNDTNGNYKPLPFTFDRAGSATRVNKQGLIEVVSNNEPRIDFLNDSKGALLLEPSRSNLITYSEDFTQSSWDKTNASITSNSAISPDGTQNASSVTGTPTTSRIRVLNTSITNDNLNRTASLFAKKEDTTSILLLQIFMSGGTGVSYNIQVDLSNGTFIDAQSVAGSGATPTDLGVEDYGSYWRIYVTGANNSTGNTAIDISILFNYGAYLGNFTPQGGTTTIWGAQLEQGSYATSYIPTQGSIGTRVAESCNGAGNDQVFNDSEGVLFAEISALNETGRIALNDGTTNNNVRLVYNASTNLIDAILFNGTNQANLAYTLPIEGGFNKIAFKYKASDFALWVDGIEVDSQVGSGTTFTSGTLSELDFDAGSNGLVPFYGNTKQIQYFDKALSDEELALLTKI